MNNEKIGIGTKYGIAHMVFTENDHCHVSTGDEGTHFKVNTVAYRLSVHLYRWAADGKFHVGEESKNTYERRMSLHGVREQWEKVSDMNITQAAREKVEPVIENAVNKFATDNEHILRAAEVEHLKDIFERAEADYNEAVEAAAKAEMERNTAKEAFENFATVGA
jgi:hypothetical protein